MQSTDLIETYAYGTRKDLQSWTKYVRQTLVSYFSAVFC